MTDNRVSAAGRPWQRLKVRSSIQWFEPLASGEKRQAFLSSGDVAGWTNHQSSDMLKSCLAQGPIDIVAVGDVTVETVVASVAATFGALPARTGTAAFGRLRHAALSGGQPPSQWPLHTPASQIGRLAKSPGGRPMPPEAGPRPAWSTSWVVSWICGHRGDTRAPGSGPCATHRANASETLASYGSLSVKAEVTPDALPTFFQTVDMLAAQLRDTPVTDDELNRARLPEIERLRRAGAGNEYWLTQLSDTVANPGQVKQTTTHISDYEAITPADIQAAGRKYFVDASAWLAKFVAP